MMVIIDLHCIKPYVSFCLKTCVKFIDENVSQLLERNVKLTCMHCGIASASQHVFGGKDAFEGWIKAGTLIFHFSSLQASVTQLGFFVMKHGLLIKKKNCDDGKLEIIVFFMAFMQSKSLPIHLLVFLLAF